MSNIQQAVLVQSTDEPVIDHGYEGDYEDFISDMLASDPTYFYPTVLGDFNIDNKIQNVLETIAAFSYSASKDEEGDDFFDSTLYAANLESIFSALYKTYNFFFQAVAYRQVFKYGTDPKAKVRIPFDPGKAFENDGVINLLVAANLKEIFLSFTPMYPTSYNIDCYLDFYNLLPDYMKENLLPQMEVLLDTVYPGNATIKAERLKKL